MGWWWWWRWVVVVMAIVVIVVVHHLCHHLEELGVSLHLSFQHLLHSKGHIIVVVSFTSRRHLWVA
jgi:hypothetical protein